MAQVREIRTVLCRVGAQRFLLPTALVREVCTGTQIVRMPGVAGAIAGVANVRGLVVTVISAAALLGIPAARPADWLVVLTSRGGRVALAVDEVEDVVQSARPGPSDRALPSILDVETLIRPLFP